MQSFIRTSAIAGLALVFSGCGTLYKLDVVSYSNPNDELDNTYVILSGNPELNVNSPEFEVYASQVERAIEPKGFQRLPADDLSAAALGVYLSVAIGDASKRYHKVSTGIYERPDGEEVSAVVTPKGTSGPNTGGGVGNVVTTPRPEQLTGYEEKTFATTVYTKHMNLVAVDLQQYINDIKEVGRNEAVPKEVWSVDVETTGKPSDLSEVLPVMLAASQPYVAHKTDDVVHVKMNGTDSRIRQIKGN